MSDTPFLSPPVFSWPAAPFGLLYTYEAMSTTPKTTYSDAAGLIPNTNPVELDATGSATIRLGSGSYKFVLLDQTNTVTLWTADNYDPPATITDITGAAVGAALYPQTTAESAVGITPTNYQYPPGVVDRYGTNTTPGTTDMTVSINAAIAAASRAEASSGNAVTFLGGVYAFSSDLTIPMGDPYLSGGGSYAITITGQGKEQTVLKAIAGGSFAHGIYFNGGAAYKNMGTLRDLQIDGNGLLVDAITLSFAQMGNIENVNVRHCTGRGLYANNVLMCRAKKMFVTTCSSNGTNQIEIDGTLAGSTGGTTTFVLDQCWAQGGAVGCVGGLGIDRSDDVTVLNGAYESSGIGAQISSKSATIGCNGVIFDAVDFESVTTAYIAIGVGLSGSNYVTGLEFRNCTGEAPGTIAQAIFMEQCNGARFVNNNFLIGGSMTSVFNLFGTSSINTVIEPHPSMNNAASTVPWVFYNGVQVRSAGPLVRWDQVMSPGLPLNGTKAVSGATWSVWVDGASANQGGWYNMLQAGNVGATSVNAIPGDQGMVIYIQGDGFSTIPQGTSGGNFDTVAGVNLLLLANHLYCFRYDNRGCWRQLGTA